MTPPPSREQVAEHLEATLLAVRRWQLGSGAGRLAGGLACPVSRIPMQWTEFFLLPLAVAGVKRDPVHEPLARGLLAYLERVQRPDGTFDAGFCGDLCQPCNAAFALRPLSTAFRDWPAAVGDEAREALRGVVARAAKACVEGGMTTPNHRWVAAAGLAHAARALEDDALREAALDWTAAGIDVDADGGFSEGSPNYALVSCDCLLDLEELCGRRDLGDLARRSLGYLRAVLMPDGAFAAVASTRYDTDGSSDSLARATCVLERLGAADLAARTLAKLWSVRTAPGLFAANVFPPLGAHPKAKQYASVTTAIASESLQRWLRVAKPDGQVEEAAGAAEGISVLRESGVLRYTHGGFGVAAGRGPNLFEVRHGGVVIEGARLLGHASGWNLLLTTAQEFDDESMRLEMTSAPGSEFVRLPQFHRAEPDKRQPGNPVPPFRARLAVSCGPGRRVRLELALEGPEGANALLEVAARPDQSLFDVDGVRRTTPHAARDPERLILAAGGPERLLLRSEGGSGHALQVDPYGYGGGDDLWSPSFRPRTIRFGLSAPTRFVLEIEGS